MRKPGQFSRAMLLACAPVACGGDAAPADVTGSELLGAWPADGSFSTGVSPGLALSELDGADREAVCIATTNAFPPLASCPSWGFLVAFNLAFDPGYEDGGALPSTERLRDVCTSMRRQCARDLAPTTDDPSECELGFRASCTGSVGQLERCVNDALAATRTLLAATPACEELTCATFPRIAQQWLADNQTFSESMGSCPELYATCSDLAGSEEPEPVATPMVADLTLECAD